MGEEERLSAIIAIRIRPTAKRLFEEMAEEKGIRLSEFIWELIIAGLDVKQKEGGDEGNV